MATRVSETYVLRTYPFRESDLIVSFFTRDQGKLRGVARRVRKPKNTFGSGLERLSLVNLSYSEKETRELVNLNSCDLLQLAIRPGDGFRGERGSRLSRRSQRPSASSA